ncbi:hypothetical protein [Streptomyces roseochromogenus]|uniref:Mercury ion transport protein n=1 Tax=Streptomyces roseochromogenus subsp. oscitans DS 12.976 TaxID=1352936 RepID=V6KZ75_STRRC|nr:hypothetical protein [Streptomyces roseochromogenus]EST34279.1 hypothetical protein M878_11020 [Streptomyces roseochromogenus subsp. oscitans DS 12.976]
MPTAPPTRRNPGSSGNRTDIAGLGIAILTALCCAGPALIASGALTGLGAWLSSPWWTTAAAALASATVAGAVHRRRKSHHACRGPAEHSSAEGSGTTPPKRKPRTYH